MTKPIDVEELRKLIRYDAATGQLRSVRTGREVFTNVHHSGYLKGAIRGRTYTAHRVAMALHHGVWPEGEVDHLNGVRSDNRAENLRCVTKSVNQRNARRRSDNTSGVTGVARRKSGSWQAYINADGGRRYLGTFRTFDEAVAARQGACAAIGYTGRHGS